MAVKARERKNVEEIFFQNRSVSLCLLVNRRQRVMRVIDFRSGASDAKRTFVVSLAQREGVAKVFTLVERDEVSAWTQMGFLREGTLSAFYKRSDAFFLGLALSDLKKTPILRVVSEDDEDEEAPAANPRHILMERTLLTAKREAKRLSSRALPAAKVTPIREADAESAVLKALRTSKAITGFEPFGRDASRVFFSLSTRAGKELVASYETQSCFGSALVEFLTAPDPSLGDGELVTYAAKVFALTKKLKDDGIASAFALTPQGDVGMATALVMQGFRRTGLLAEHVHAHGKQEDGILWSKKFDVEMDGPAASA